MARRNASDTAVLSVRIDAEISNQLEGECEARMIGKGFLVEKAIEAYLPTLPALPGTQSLEESLATDHAAR